MNDSYFGYGSDIEEEKYTSDIDVNSEKKTRDKAYTRRLTGFKYGIEESRAHGKSEGAAFLKRGINRAARRVGRAMVKEYL